MHDYYFFTVYEKSIPKLQTQIDRHTIFFESNNIKWGFRKYLENRIKQIYTYRSFMDDKIALIRVSELEYIFWSQFKQISWPCQEYDSSMLIIFNRSLRDKRNNKLKHFSTTALDMFHYFWKSIWYYFFFIFSIFFLLPFYASTGHPSLSLYCWKVLLVYHFENW